MRYFDDFEVGAEELSDEAYEVTQESIIEFAKEWDPLPFHIDEEAAKETPIGRLIASGAQTFAIAIKLQRTMETDGVAYVAGTGWEKVQLHAPVMAGHVLRLRTRVVDKRDSATKHDRGLMTIHNEIIDQQDNMLMQYELKILLMKRPQ